MFSLALPTFILSSLLLVLADPVPTAPSPGQVFNAGSTCTIAWTPDTTGIWKNLDIELMTGDNINMVFLTTVASVDGTASPGTHSYPCPNVTPNSAIYFYQFTSAASSNRSWTGRFAIASSTGATVPPANAVQPNGDPIPWGLGALTDPSTAVPAPSYLSVSTNSTSLTNTTSVSSSVTPSSTVLSSSSSSSVSPSDTPSSKLTSSPAITTSTSSSNSAGGLVVGAVSMRAAQAGVALSVIAATFTFLF